MLQLLARQGSNGVTREDFYSNIRALRYEELMNSLNELEADGLIRFEWLDSARFYAFITDKGAEFLKATGFLKGDAIKSKADISNVGAIERL